MSEPQSDKTRVLVRPGATFAHYKILEKIGAGGMGEVYLVHDTKLDRRVALKLLPDAMTDHPDVRARFLREARAAARLDHPNIITIYEVGEFEGRPYIAMQYVEGRPLSHFAGGEARGSDVHGGAPRGESPTLPQVLAIVSGICEGLAQGARRGDHPSRHQARQHSFA